MNNFKIGDIVLFSWKPIYDYCAPWRKGKIVAISSNVSLNNPANFVSKPEYYVSEVDDNNNIIDSRQLFAIDKNSEYILKFLPGMESMIGKNTYYIKSEHDIDKEKKLSEHDADKDYAEDLRRNLASFIDMIDFDGIVEKAVKLVSVIFESSQPISL